MKKYSKEFKDEALKLSDEIGARKAARQLSLQYNILVEWQKERNPGKIVTGLYIFFIIVFITGILLAMIGRALCVLSTDDYQKILPEINTVEEIRSLLVHPDTGYIYVCYNDGSCVNVYNSEGKFVWAVSTPYLRNVHFGLKDGNLIICNSIDAYLYNDHTGKFISKKQTESLNLRYNYVKTGNVYFNTYNVFKIEDNGSYNYIVQRPIWYYVFNFMFDWIISFFSITSAGITMLIVNSKKYIKDFLNKKNSKKLRLPKYIRYIKTTIGVHLVYILLNILGGVFLKGIFCIGIIPITIHFAVSNIIISNIRNKNEFRNRDETSYSFWSSWSLATFICAFLSVAVVASFAKI